MVRVDKYLWAIRVFKTRSLASEACRKGRVLINDQPVKPSRAVDTGEIISVKKMPVVYVYRIIKPIEKRVGAKIVSDFMQDITPEEELAKLELQDDFFVKRARGSGRPTKKERRLLDNIQDNS